MTDICSKTPIALYQNPACHGGEFDFHCRIAAVGSRHDGVFQSSVRTLWTERVLAGKVLGKSEICVKVPFVLIGALHSLVVR